MEKVVSTVIDIYPDDNLASLLSVFGRLNRYGGFVAELRAGKQRISKKMRVPYFDPASNTTGGVKYRLPP